MSYTWIALRRPLFVAFVLGCTVSLLATGRLTLTLIAGSTLAWTFVPAAEAFAVAIVTRRSRVPFSRRLDVFFAGHGPWTALTILVGAVGSLPPQWWFNAWLPVLMPCVAVAAVLVAMWSWRIDLAFYRGVIGRSAREAIADASMQRALAWTIGLVYFFGFAVWPEIVDRLP